MPIVKRHLFRDSCPVTMSAYETETEARKARRAGAQAKESLTLTAKRQYRRYRADATEKFLDWGTWHVYYLEGYNGFSGYKGGPPGPSQYIWAAGGFP